MSKLKTAKEVTIAASGTKSSSLDLSDGHVPVGVWTPDTVTSTSFSFEGKRADGTYVEVEDGSGSLKSYTMSGGEYIPLNPQDFAGVSDIKLVSGSTEGAARTFYFSTREFY